MTLIEEAFDRAFHEPYCIPVEVKTGFVAFMDILGFSNIRATKEGFRSRWKNAAGVIFGLMKDVLSEKNELIKCLDPRYGMSDEEADTYKMTQDELARIRQGRELIKKSISLHFISDSLICLAGIHNEDERKSSLITTAFFTLLSTAVTNMFRHGLPLRGGVSFGEFVTNNSENSNLNSFLGEALIRAHALECSGLSATVILDEQAEKKCKELYRPWLYEKDVNGWMNLCEADIVQKNSDKASNSSNKSQTHTSISRRTCINIRETSLYIDRFTHFVEDSFSDHGKDISANRVQQKIENTVQFLKSRNRVLEIYGPDTR